MIFSKQTKKAVSLGICLCPVISYSSCPSPSILQEKSQAPDKVYRNQPFGPGEKASYEVHYFGVLVGHGHLEVRKPIKHNHEWYQHFVAHARTGEWYRAIFVANDFAMAYSHPTDFSVSKFYIKQDEGKIFSKRFIQEKWLSFDHERCQVSETIKKPESKPLSESAELSPGAMDSLSVIYKIRSMDFEIGNNIKLLVYSSKKNWWLEAMPQSHEEVSVPAGTFKTTKLKLQTYIGKELQQRGDVYAWIADEHRNRPLVKLTGEVKIGSGVMELVSYRSSEGNVILHAPTTN